MQRQTYSTPRIHEFFSFLYFPESILPTFKWLVIRRTPGSDPRIILRIPRRSERLVVLIEPLVPASAGLLRRGQAGDCVQDFILSFEDLEGETR